MKRERRVYETVYFTTRWKKCREYILAVRGFQCEECYKLLGKREYNVHHITPLNEENYTDPNVVYGEHNLQLLCITCHNVKHDRTLKVTDKGVYFDKITGEMLEKPPTLKVL